MTTMRGTLGLGPSPAPAYRETSDWKMDAACRDEDPELFYFPEGERGIARRNREAAAVKVCNRCTVRAACLADNLAVADQASEYGVVGGLTEEQRLPLIKAARGDLKAKGIHRRAKRAPCGTEAGYRAHKSRDEKPCERCRFAMNEYQRTRRLARKEAAS